MNGIHLRDWYNPDLVNRVTDVYTIGLARVSNEARVGYNNTAIKDLALSKLVI